MSVSTDFYRVTDFQRPRPSEMQYDQENDPYFSNGFSRPRNNGYIYPAAAPRGNYVVPESGEYINWLPYEKTKESQNFDTGKQNRYNAVRRQPRPRRRPVDEEWYPNQVGRKSYRPPMPTLYVSGIPANASLREVRHIFRQYNGLLSVMLHSAQDGKEFQQCFVEFKTFRDADYCIANLNNIYVFDIDDPKRTPIRVEYKKMSTKYKNKPHNYFRQKNYLLKDSIQQSYYASRETEQTPTGTESA